MSAGKLKVREIAELAMISALVIGGKETMNALPNIHPVALLLIMSTLLYGAKAIYVALTFSLAEVLLYGASSAFYLYVWPLLVLLALPFRGNQSRTFWAAFAGIFGLCFGALSALQYLFIGGWSAAFSYWISGIPFDLAHGFGNAVMTFLLLQPLCRAVNKVKGYRI